MTIRPPTYELQYIRPPALQQAPSSELQSEHRPGYIKNFVKDERMIQVLKQKGIKELFPIQYKTFDIIYQGQDIIAKDRTGSGKTLAFSLPIIERMRAKGILRASRYPKFLIMLPTRQLTLQVFGQLNSLKLHPSQYQVVAVYGGADMRRQIQSIQRGVDIMVATPGRLIDLISQGVIRFDSLEVVTLDQADQMLKRGFQQDVEKIFEAIRSHTQKKTQNLFFSATIPPWITQMSFKYQSKATPFIDLIKSLETSASKTVKHLSLEIRPFDSKELIIQKLIKRYNKEDGRVMIFCQTKRDVARVGERLRQSIRCEVLHGDIPQNSREGTFRRFKAGVVRCIVATNVAARGLDFPQIQIVIQVEPPKETDSYIHRSGRTGRAGRDGIAITLYTDKMRFLMDKIQRQSKIKMERIMLGSLEEGNLQQKRNQFRGRSVSRSNSNDRFKRERERRRSPQRYVIPTRPFPPKFEVNVQKQVIPNGNGLNGKVPQKKRSISSASVRSKSVRSKSSSSSASSSKSVDGAKKESKPSKNHKNTHSSSSSSRSSSRSSSSSSSRSAKRSHKRSSRNSDKHRKHIKKSHKRSKRSSSSSSSSSNKRERERRQPRRGSRSPRRSPRRQQRQRDPRPSNSNRNPQVFFGGLSKSTTEDDLLYFLKKKDIQVNRVKILKELGDSKGCGFITFYHQKEIEHCLKLSGSQIDGRRISIRRLRDRD